MNRETNMTTGRPIKLILSFALPLIAGNLGQQLYMITDAIIVGQGTGTEGLAAVGATDWTYWLFLWIIQALTQGFAIIIAQKYGEGDEKQLRKCLAMSVLLCLAAGIFLTAVGLCTASPILHLLQTPSSIFERALSYLTIMFSGLLVVMAYNMAASILRAFGDGRTSLIAIAIAASVNIALDVCFVFICKWGVAGAAIATIIAQLIAFLYCVLSLRKMQMIKLCRDDWKFDKKMVFRLSSMGLSLSCNHTLVAVGGMILQSAINRQGALFVTGYTAANKLYGLLESSAFALEYSVTTYTAQNYGAGFYHRIHQGIKNAIVIAFGLSAGISLAMFLWGKKILHLFINFSDKNAAEVLAIAYHYLFVMSCFLFSLYLLHVLKSLLTGLECRTATMFAGVMEFLARVSIALYFSRLYGQEAIFYAEPSAWSSAVIFMAIASVFILRKKCTGLSCDSL